ncbi:MAG: ATP-binding protein [Bacteroidota bacterium]
MQKKLPIGIQTLSKIIEGNYYYVDKTPFVYQLANQGGGYYFLSRPRRFGKSLFVDTLKQAFSGNRELFKGLYLENNWDWSKRYPVIHIDFAMSSFQTPESLSHRISNLLKEQAEQNNIELKEQNNYERFRELILELNKKFNEKVVILIDEYDKPILDKIEDKSIAEANREVLRNFYSVIKASDSYIKFVFITGVTKFNKVSIFSGLNQLEDITIDKRYSAICGYAEEELVKVFSEELKNFDIEKIRHWYNGYSWLGESVYNPFDVLLLFSKQMYHPYWFQTGTPTFLMKLIKENKYYLPQLENIEITDKILDSFDIDNISIENLLFQTGYLTIKETRTSSSGKILYTLTYPNFEVKTSFNEHLLDYLSSVDKKSSYLIQVEEIFEKNRIEELKNVLHSFYASIPYEWYIKNELDKYEGYYASVLYALMISTGLDIVVEDNTNKGRVDMVIRYNNKAYIMEFKVIKDEKEKGSALQQIKTKKYFEKYQSTSEEIYLIGMEFSEQQRNIINFEIEKMK